MTADKEIAMRALMSQAGLTAEAIQTALQTFAQLTARKTRAERSMFPAKCASSAKVLPCIVGEFNATMNKAELLRWLQENLSDNGRYKPLDNLEGGELGVIDTSIRPL